MFLINDSESTHKVTSIREPLFGSRQLKVAEMNGRAGDQNKKVSVKPQRNAASERQTTKIFQKSPVQINTIFAHLKTNGRADGNFPNMVQCLLISPSTS